MQESAPEQLELKQALLARADRAAPPRHDHLLVDVRAPPDRPAGRACAARAARRRPSVQPRLPAPARRGLRRRADRPDERSSALLPSTGPSACTRFTSAPRSTGSSPTGCSRHSGARRSGWCTTTSRPCAEIDDAIRYGAGLRWAYMGTFLTYRIAGGEAGMRHFLSQFGPALAWPWTKLMDVPELERRADRPDRRRSPTSRPAADRCASSNASVTTRSSRSSRPAGAGDRRRRDTRRLGARPARQAAARATRPATDALAGVPTSALGRLQRPRPREPLPAGRSPTRRDALLASVGSTRRPRRRRSYFTVETHLSHLRQLQAGDRVTVTTQVLAADEKRLHVFHVLLRDGEAGTRRNGGADASARRRNDRRTRRTRRNVRERVTHLRDEHASLPRPERAGRSVGAIDEPRSPSALRAAVARDRRSVDRPGKWGYWFARDAVQGLAPPARPPRRTQRRRGARPARAPLARRAAGGA